MDIINLCYPILGAISGSVFYLASYDVYHLYITRKQRFVRQYEKSLLINPGLFLGFLLGYSRYVCGMSLLECYL